MVGGLSQLREGGREGGGRGGRVRCREWEEFSSLRKSSLRTSPGCRR